MSKHIFECIDAHTCGNPVRLILTENPELEGISMSEKRLDFLKHIVSWEIIKAINSLHQKLLLVQFT